MMKKIIYEDADAEVDDAEGEEEDDDGDGEGEDKGDDGEGEDCLIWIWNWNPSCRLFSSPSFPPPSLPAHLIMVIVINHGCLIIVIVNRSRLDFNPTLHQNQRTVRNLCVRASVSESRISAFNLRSRPA